jgi:CRISPR/Cas system CSM-associated protein Csm4 (group 5 of RAMP superfamily)
MWQGRRNENCKAFWLLDKQRENIDCEKKLEESLREHPALRTLVAWTQLVLMLLAEHPLPI